MAEQNNSDGTIISSLVTKALEKKRKRKEEIEFAKRPTLEEALFAQFDVIETISKSGQGSIVYHLAKKNDPSKQICCKAPQESDNPLHCNILVNEATKLEICQHPNIVKFSKFGRELKTPYFITEWIPGENLADKVKRHNGKGFRHDHIAWLIYQVSGALEYIHSHGICHLDVKPANIMIGDEDEVKLIDFGAAKYFDEKDGTIQASLHYTSPDYVSSGEGKPEDDVFSLAVITYYLFMGTGVTSDLATVIKKQSRPAQIPAHVWKLLKGIILKPRSHDFSPITFAQALGQIDVGHDLGGSPIFKNLRNADLVLYRRKSMPSNIIEGWKWLEASLIAAVAVLVVVLVFRNVAFYSDYHNSLENNASQKLYDLASRYLANTLDQEPWITEASMKTLLAGSTVSNDDDRKKIEQFIEQRNLVGQTRYEEESAWLNEQRQYRMAVNEKLVELQQRAVKLRQWFLLNNIESDLDAEELLGSMMADLNEAVQLNEVTENYYLTPQNIVHSIEGGNAQVVEGYLHGAWKRAEAQSYYFSHVLRNDTIDQVVVRANKLAQKSHYTQAINLVLSAKKILGTKPELDKLVGNLYVARGEYVLFSAVNGIHYYDIEQIHKAISDIGRFSPQKAESVRHELKTIIDSRLSHGYIRGTNSSGLINVNRVLFPDSGSEV